MDSVLAGDEERALSLLHPDVVLISDAGPARRAARHPSSAPSGCGNSSKAAGDSSDSRPAPSPDERPPARLIEVNSSPSLVLDAPDGPIVITGEAVAARSPLSGSGSTPTRPQRSRIRRLSFEDLR